jgi:xylulokinase
MDTNDLYYICIDAGTSRFKSACITSSGDVVSQSDYRYGSYRNSTHEYSTNDFENALSRTLEKITSTLDPGRISAVGITGHGPTLIPVAKDGTMLSGGIGYLDERVNKYISRLAEKKTDHVTSTMYIPIASFFKDELPDVYEKTYKFLQSFDYLAFLLTGCFTASSSSSGIKPWEQHKVEQAGLDTGKFPGIRYLGSPIGTVTRHAAQRYRIPESTPLYAIGVDFAASLIGTGAITPGRSCERAGTSGGLNLCSDHATSDRRLLSYTHFMPGCWNIAGITSSSGISVEWAKRVFGENCEKEFTASDTGSKPRGRGIIFLPYLRGERTPIWNPYARGVFFGIDDSHTASDMFESVLTGVALSIRDIAQIMQENGLRFTGPVVSTGGGSRNRRLVQLKADVVGKPFCVTGTRDAELTGIACVLAVQDGLYPGLLEATERLVRTTKVFFPDPNRKEGYDALYERYRKLRETLSSCFQPANRQNN